jgi:glucosamine 6-phosphate synthetase-like amidotransferase/phosphosugar isomerase protein
MYEEIISQQRILDNFNKTNKSTQHIFGKLSFDEIWLTGSGDSHCASLFGASLLNQLEIKATAFTPMDLSNFHQSAVENPCLIAISVSGKTPRVLEVIIKFKQKYPNSSVIGLTDNVKSELYRLSTHPVLINASPTEALESSDYQDDIAKQYTGYHHDVAQTKTYFANILYLIKIAQELSNITGELQETITLALSNFDQWISKCDNWVQSHPLSNPGKTIFVGSGIFSSLSQFGQYKWFEFTLPGLKQDIEEYAHTHYFTTDSKTSVVFLTPKGAHLKRVSELIDGALKELIQPEMYLTGCTSDLTIPNQCVMPAPPNDLTPIWQEVILYLFSLIFIEWLTYHTAKNEGFDTNRFRGGVDSEKYVRGSYQTIRQSKISDSSDQ